MEADRAGKSRLHMMTEGPTVLIRANQGHTITSIKEDQLLTAITDPSEVPICLHGTYLQAWELIKGSHLNRMVSSHTATATAAAAHSWRLCLCRGDFEAFRAFVPRKDVALGALTKRALKLCRWCRHVHTSKWLWGCPATQGSSPASAGRSRF